MIPFDSQFIQRVYRTSGWFSLLAAFACWRSWGAPAALGIASGVILDLACLYTIQRGVQRFIHPQAYDYRPLMLYLLGMYPALIIALWLIVQCHFLNLPAVAAGIALPNLVMFLKAVGQKIIQENPAAS